MESAEQRPTLKDALALRDKYRAEAEAYAGQLRDAIDRDVGVARELGGAKGILSGIEMILQAVQKGTMKLDLDAVLVLVRDGKAACEAAITVLRGTGEGANRQ